MDPYSGFPDPLLYKTREELKKTSSSEKLEKENLNQKIDNLIQDKPLSFLESVSSYASKLGQTLFGSKISEDHPEKNKEILEKISNISEKTVLTSLISEEDSLSSAFVNMEQGQEALENLTEHHDESLIKDYSSPEIAEKEIEKVSKEVKENTSQTEKMEGFGKIVGILIETIPTSIEAIETGEAVIFDRFFKGTMELVGVRDNPLVGSTIAAGGSVLLTLLSTKIKDRVEFYKDKLNELENNKGSEKEILKCKGRIVKLEKYWMRTFSKLDLGTLLHEKGALSQAVETITPLLPKAQHTFKEVCKGGGPILEVIGIAADTVLIKQRHEALEICQDMKSALQKEREFMLKKLQENKGQEDQKTLEKIKSLEKEINIIEEKIIYQEFRFTSKSIDLVLTIIKKAAVLLPGNADLFLKLGSSLSILRNAVDIGLPGRMAIQHMQKIKEIREQSASLDKDCERIQEEIKHLKTKKLSSEKNKNLNQLKIRAKEFLIQKLEMKKIALEAAISHSVFAITQNLVVMAQSGTSLSKEALTLLSLGKAVSTMLGGIGTAFLATNLFLTIAKYTLIDTSSIERWIDQQQLSYEKYDLKEKIFRFHLYAKTFSENFSDLKEVETKVLIKRCQNQMHENEKTIDNLYSEMKNSNTQEMKELGKQIIALQNDQNILLSLCIHLQDMKEEMIPPKKFVEIKQKIMNKMNQFFEIQTRVFERENKELQQKEVEIEKNYWLNHKLQPLGLDQESYSEFKQDLKKILQVPEVFDELSKYVREKDQELWEKIFARDQEMNIDLLTDFLIPPVG